MDIIEKIDSISEAMVYWKIAVMNPGERRPTVKEVVPSSDQADHIMRQLRREYKFVDMRPTNRQEYDDHLNPMKKVEWGSITFAGRRLSL